MSPKNARGHAKIAQQWSRKDSSEGSPAVGAWKRATSCEAPDVPEDTSKVNIHELAVKMLPSVRKSATLQVQETLRKRLAFDKGNAGVSKVFATPAFDAGNASYPADFWARLAWSLGCDPRHFVKVLEKTGKGKSAERSFRKPPGTTGNFAKMVAFKGSAGGLDVGTANPAKLEVAARAITCCWEAAQRARRKRERDIQEEEQIDEETFKEMRPHLIDMHERFQHDAQGRPDGRRASKGTDWASVTKAAETMMREFGFFPMTKSMVLQKARIRGVDFMAELWSLVGSLTESSFTFKTFLWLCHLSRDMRMKIMRIHILKRFQSVDKQGAGLINHAQASNLLEALGLVPQTRDQQRGIALLYLESQIGSEANLSISDFELLQARVD